MSLKAGQDADLRGVTHARRNFAGQDGGHQVIAAGLVENK